MKSTLKSGPMRMVLTSFLVVACATPALDPTEITYAPDLGVKLGRMTLTEEGLYWQDLTLGVLGVAPRFFQEFSHLVGRAGQLVFVANQQLLGLLHSQVLQIHD